MQDRYAGDVGDFGKFGLLRHLCGETAQDKHPPLKAGVIWYRANPGRGEKEKPDGKFVNYLQTAVKTPRLHMDCDAPVFDALGHIVAHERTIQNLERANLLTDAVYWQEDVRHGKIKSTCPRADWFQGAFEATAGCDLVFLDPDNGIECTGLRPTQGESRKYVLRREIRLLIARKSRPSIVIYQQMGRTKGTAKEKTERQLKCLSDELGLPVDERPFAVIFRRGTARAYLILPSRRHYQVLWERTDSLLQKWGTEEWEKGKPRGHFNGPILI